MEPSEKTAPRRRFEGKIRRRAEATKTPGHWESIGLCRKWEVQWERGHSSEGRAMQVDVGDQVGASSGRAICGSNHSSSSGLG